MNPKGKKSITLTVSKESDLTGRKLNEGLRQLYLYLNDRIEKEDMDHELLQEIWKIVIL